MHDLLIGLMLFPGRIMLLLVCCSESFVSVTRLTGIMPRAGE